MKFTKLSHQILVVFVAVVVLSLGLSGWAVTSLAQRIVTDNILRGHQELARRIADEISSEMEDIQPVLSLLVESAVVRSMDPAGVTTALIAYQTRFPSLTAISVADLSGMQIARTDGQPPENVATTYGFQVAREGHELVSDVYLPQNGQRPTLTIYRPIIEDPVNRGLRLGQPADSDQGERMVGVLIADINFSRVQAILELLALRRGETVAVFAPNGQTIAHSHIADLVEPPSLTDPGLIETLVQGQAGVLENYTDESDRSVTGVHTPVKELGWGVVIQTPVAKLEAEIATLRRTMLIGLLGGVALAIIAGWLMANRLAKPVDQLARAAEQVAAGDLSVSVEATAPNEIGRLANTFNQMVVSIQQAQAGLGASEARYRALFEDSPIALWEEDFSALKRYLDSLQASGIKDLRAYFEQHPETVRDCVTMVKLVDVNRAALSMYQVDSKAELLVNLNQIFREESYAVFQEELICLADGKQVFEAETVHQTLQGAKSYVSLKMTIVPGYEETWSKVFVSVTDITERVRAEEALRQYRDRLEDLVEARTAELTTSNEQLEREIVERKRAEESLRTALNWTEALYRTSRSLIAIENLAQLLQAVADGVAETLPADRVTLITVDMEARQVTHFVKSGPGLSDVVAVSFDELWYGLSGWVLRELKPALSPKEGPDPRESPAVQQRRVATNCGAIIVIPLRYRNKILGTLTAINRPDERDFTQEDVALMMSLANHAAIAIENARLYEETARRAEELAALYEIGKEITATLELDTMLQTIAADAVTLVRADRSLILLIDAKKEKLTKAVGHGYSRTQLEKHTLQELHDGISGWVFQQRVPTLSADIQTDERNRGRALTSACRSNDKSVAVAPLLIGDEVIGTLTVINGPNRRTFTATDLNLVTMLAGQATIAIHNGRLYEAAQEADRLKSAFLATMSHELRTPLNSIIGFTGILLQGLAGPLNDEQNKQLGMVRGSARHLLELINDVLDISKIEAGQLKVSSEPFDMREAIEKVVRTVTPMAEQKGLALMAEIAPEVGQVVSDRRRVEQIVINLVNNAVKFTEAGEVRVECGVHNGWLVTQVVDTGIGIKPEDMKKLFKPFRQIDTGITRKREGTGLGLSICKKLTEMLGGEISVKSEWGGGSTFTFTLPL